MRFARAHRAPDPTLAAATTFTGALLPLGPLEVLVVVVAPTLLDAAGECRLTVAAYHARFGRPVVLMGIAPYGSPRYFGPERIVPLVAAMPFELVPWRQFTYGAPVYMLPTHPIDRTTPEESIELASADLVRDGHWS